MGKLGGLGKGEIGKVKIWDMLDILYLRQRKERHSFESWQFVVRRL